MLNVFFWISLTVLKAQTLTGAVDAVAVVGPPCAGCVEIAEQRTESGKVFRDPSDPRTLYIQRFGGPVHVLDENGVWREPDPRLLFDSGAWITTRAFRPLAFRPGEGVRIALPDGFRLSLNANNRIVTTNAEGQETYSQALNTAGADVNGTRIFAPNAAPNLNMIQTAKVAGLKTDYELLSPPDDNVVYWAVEEQIPLPPGYTVDFDVHGETTYLGRLGEVVLYDAAGNEAARWARPKIFDSHPGRTDQERQALLNAALQAGIPQTPYAYRLSVENGVARLRLVVDAKILRLPQTVYPVVIDPEVTVPFASSVVLGVGQNMTCSLPLPYAVPGGYSVVNVVNNMLRYQATGLCCGIDLFGICFGPSCAFNGVRARIVGPCGQAEGFCNSTAQGTCTLTGDVPFVADCVVGQCTDYPIELRAELTSQIACGGTTCAATNCYRMDAGDIAFTLVARSVETTASTDVAPIAGTPPTVQVCGETPFHLVGLPAYGVPPYTFEWHLPDGSVLADSMPMLTLYENTPITLIAFDACGQSEPYTFTVTTVAPPTFSETVVMPTCGIDNGSITLTNLPPDASIVWENGSSAVTRNNLPPGQYVAMVSDGVCPKTKVYLLEAVADAVNLTVQTTAPTCTNPSAGAIVLVAQGAFGPYEYAAVPQGQFPDYQASPNFTGLGEGVYTLQIRDVNACVYIHPEPVVFSVPEPIVVGEITTVANACFGANTGSIHVGDVSGGTGNYQYSLSGGPWQTSPTFTGLSHGTFGLRVRDDGGCEYAGVVVVPLAPSLNVLDVLTEPVLCDAPGRLVVVVEGGTPPYTYSFDNGQNFTTEAQYSGDERGTFRIRVRDANGCVTGVETQLPGVRRVGLAHTYRSPSCAGVADGAIQLFSNADEYSLDGGQTFLTTADFTGPVGLFEGLSQGLYSVVVRNADGCEARAEILLPALAPEMEFRANRETICTGDEVWVHVLGPQTVEWNVPPGGPELRLFDNGTLVGFRPLSTVVFTVVGDFGAGCSISDTWAATVLPKNVVSAGFLPKNTVFERPPFAVEFINTSETDLEYLWDFGDESVSTEFSPTRVYSDTGRYEVKLTVRRPGTCDEAVVRQTIHVTTTAPMSRSLQAEGFVLFPNPTDGRVEIVSSVGLSVVVYDLRGRKVAAGQVHGRTELDLGALPSGVYAGVFTRADGARFVLKIQRK